MSNTDENDTSASTMISPSLQVHASTREDGDVEDLDTWFQDATRELERVLSPAAATTSSPSHVRTTRGAIVQATRGQSIVEIASARNAKCAYNWEHEANREYGIAGHG